jgi:hypothetical protein
VISYFSNFFLWFAEVLSYFFYFFLRLVEVSNLEVKFSDKLGVDFVKAISFLLESQPNHIEMAICIIPLHLRYELSWFFF